MDILEKIWVEKYRPKKIEDFIGNEQLTKIFKSYIDRQDIPNLLLYGTAGVGKTTIAKVLVNSIDCEYMFINASDENNVDTVRNKIKNFSSSMSFNKFKVVLCDECLEENTPVWVLREGSVQLIPIKDLQDKTDLVKSLNIDTEKIEWRPFDLIDVGYKDLYEIEFENNEKIYCTEDHKWYVKIEDTIKILKTKEIIDKLSEIDIFIYNAQGKLRE